MSCNVFHFDLFIPIEILNEIENNKILLLL